MVTWDLQGYITQQKARKHCFSDCYWLYQFIPPSRGNFFYFISVHCFSVISIFQKTIAIWSAILFKLAFKWCGLVAAFSVKKKAFKAFFWGVFVSCSWLKQFIRPKCGIILFVSRGWWTHTKWQNVVPLMSKKWAKRQIWINNWMIKMQNTSF